ncbi:ABC transporter substrate-binding protein [Aeromicrobium sp. CTD01-1L150]|uniref:ABC transporter substrate-binding protein n=1 Tax=Aeromicrobium sp. CTD01-1L150 TaxID=3341830 RepID=UPI0035C14C3B
MVVTSHPSHDGLSRRTLMKSAFGVAVGVAALGSLGACARGAETASGKGFTFLSYLPMESLSMSPELMADAGGYFADQGLAVTFQTTKGSPQAIQTLVAGRAPLTRIGAIDVMTAAADGQPLVNVATLVRGSSIRILYHQDQPLSSPADFRGVKMGIPSEGGTSDKTLSLMMDTDGFDPKEVERQVVGLGPGTFELVKRGDIAGYMVSIDQALTAMKQYPGEAAVFDPGFSIRADSQVYAATTSSIDEHGEMITKYLTAIDNACQSIVDDDDLQASIETMRTKHSFAALDDDSIARDALEQARILWTRDGQSELMTTDTAYWSEAYEQLVGAGMLRAGQDPSAWVSNDLLA